MTYMYYRRRSQLLTSELVDMISCAKLVYIPTQGSRTFFIQDISTEYTLSR